MLKYLTLLKQVLTVCLRFTEEIEEYPHQGNTIKKTSTT